MKALVVIVTIIGLSAVIGSIIVGKMVFEGKVVDKPYETGLRYDEMEKTKARFIFKLLNKEFHAGDNDIIFSIMDTSGIAVTDPHIILTLSRPSTTTYDREYRVNFIESGKYTARIRIPVAGYWDMKIRFIHDSQTVILEKRIYAAP